MNLADQFKAAAQNAMSAADVERAMLALPESAKQADAMLAEIMGIVPTLDPSVSSQKKASASTGLSEYQLIGLWTAAIADDQPIVTSTGSSSSTSLNLPVMPGIVSALAGLAKKYPKAKTALILVGAGGAAGAAVAVGRSSITPESRALEYAGLCIANLQALKAEALEDLAEAQEGPEADVARAKIADYDARMAKCPEYARAVKSDEALGYLEPAAWAVGGLVAAYAAYQAWRSL